MITLYKDNRTDLKYEITEEELSKRFVDYVKTLPIDHVEHFSYSNKLCRNFILESGDVADDYEKIDEILMPVKSKIVSQILENKCKK